MYANLHYAVLSGCSASMGSTFGKISGLSLFQDLFILRPVFVAAMIFCNSFGWTLFVKALQQNQSSLPATVISSASNYICSALTGFLIFGEVTSLMWWSGMGFIIIGLLGVLSDQETNLDLNTKKS